MMESPDPEQALEALRQGIHNNESLSEAERRELFAQLHPGNMTILLDGLVVWPLPSSTDAPFDFEEDDLGALNLSQLLDLRTSLQNYQQQVEEFISRAAADAQQTLAQREAALREQLAALERERAALSALGLC